jgi:hypothetical protein
VAIVEGSWLLLLGFSIGLVIVEALAITGAGTAALAAAVEREASGADLAVEQLTSPFSKASSVFVDLSAMLLTDLTTETKDMGQDLFLDQLKIINTHFSGKFGGVAGAGGGVGVTVGASSTLADDVLTTFGWAATWAAVAAATVLGAEETIDAAVGVANGGGGGVAVTSG